MDANFKDKYPNACDACIQRVEKVRAIVLRALSAPHCVRGDRQHGPVGQDAADIWNRELDDLANCQHRKDESNA